MRPFVPARSAYTTWTAGGSGVKPSEIPDSAGRKLLGPARRVRLRSIAVACTDAHNLPFYEHQFYFCSESGTPEYVSGGTAPTLFQFWANRSLDGVHLGVSRYPIGIDLPGSGIVFDNGIYLYTHSAGDNKISGYTVTVIYT